MGRLLIWSGLVAWRTEVADLDLRPDALGTAGTQIGVDPLKISRFEWRPEGLEPPTRGLGNRAAYAVWLRIRDAGQN
jgi:hypothetical protein